MYETLSEMIVIAANFTIESISGSLANFLGEVSLNFDLDFAPYNQILQQLLDPASLFNQNLNGVNIVYLRLEDLIESRGSDIQFVKGQLDKIRDNAYDLAKYLRAAEQFSVPLYVFLCPPSAGIRGDVELATEFKAIEQTIRETVTDVPNLYLFETEHLPSLYAIASIDNPQGNILGHVPYTAEFISALAVETVRKIDASRRRPLKVLALDCDNTLWDGVVGEDGVSGVCLSGKRLFLQDFAVKQSESGMVVCLISKNNEADVWAVFDERNDMVLTKEHIVSSRINWLPKSENLKSIAEELQLGLESFVLIDDDPAVCSEVQRNCPEVFTVLLPPEVDDYSGFFDHLWVFDKLKISREDRERTQSYHNQARRREVQFKAADLTEFLNSLELVCEISELSNADISRVSQLTLRTNQFNSTTVRLSEADIRSKLANGHKAIWTVKVSDRFGDYGLVGAVIFEESENSLFVESFMLSCRVLGRGVEYEILKELGKKALASDREFVSIDFVRTAKNVPILSFLTEISGRFKTSDASSTIYKIPVTEVLACSPKSNWTRDRSTPTVNTHYQPDAPRAVPEVNRSQVYIEIANSLSTSGSVTFKGAPTESPRENLRTEFRPARTDTERKLTQIWEQALNIENIGILDNFFELGGTSLQAIDLFVKIEASFGKLIPLATLFEADTIKRLADILDRDEWAAPESSIVAIQPNGLKPPFFCIHAKGGNVLFYHDLAKHLSTDQPFYAIQARRLGGRQIGHATVEEMATFYIDEIKRVQPDGPYYLGGSSFGGLGAFEIAQQLRRRGEKIALLALFDTGTPDYPKLLPTTTIFRSKIYELIRRVQHHKNSLRAFNSKERAEYIVDKLKKVRLRWRRQISDGYKKAVRRFYLSAESNVSIPSSYIHIEDQIWKAEKKYRPKVYPGKVTLFRASVQPLGIQSDTTLGWKDLVAGELEIHEVPGHHGSIVTEPYVGVLANKLEGCLTAVQSRKKDEDESAILHGSESGGFAERRSSPQIKETSWMESETERDGHTAEKLADQMKESSRL